MNPILLWLVVYVLPFAAAYLVVRLSPRRWMGSLSSNIVVVHIALIVSILASQYVLHALGHTFPWNFWPWVLAYVVSSMLAFALLGVFGLWYALSALLQQLTMLSISFLLFPALPLYAVVALVVSVYTVAHFMRMNWDLKKAVVFIAWGTASVCLFFIFPSPWPLAALHTLFGALLIKRGLLYREANLGAARIEDLLKKDTYQVFLMTCPATLPFSFATHPWLVVNRKGVVSRHGVSWRAARFDGVPAFGAHLCKECSGHVHKDGRPPYEGIEIFPLVSTYLWNGKVLDMIDGGDDSLAARMAAFIDRSIAAYPYQGRYALLGPNSNTYVAWILAQFPESDMRLPWNAFGKGYAGSNALSSSNCASARS